MTKEVNHFKVRLCRIFLGLKSPQMEGEAEQSFIWRHWREMRRRMDIHWVILGDGTPRASFMYCLFSKTNKKAQLCFPRQPLWWGFVDTSEARERDTEIYSLAQHREKFARAASISVPVLLVAFFSFFSSSAQLHQTAETFLLSYLKAV